MIILYNSMYKQNVGGSRMVKTENFISENTIRQKCILLIELIWLILMALSLAYIHENK